MCLHVHAQYESVAQRVDVAYPSLPQELPRAIADGLVDLDVDPAVRAAREGGGHDLRVDLRPLPLPVVPDGGAAA